MKFHVALSLFAASWTFTLSEPAGAGWLTGLHERRYKLDADPPRSIVFEVSQFGVDVAYVLEAFARSVIDPGVLAVSISSLAPENPPAGQSVSEMVACPVMSVSEKPGAERRTFAPVSPA